MPDSSFALAATIVSALVATGLAGFVLHCNRRAPANRWLALGLFVIALHEVLLLAFALAPAEPWHTLLLRCAVGVVAAVPPTWLGFSLTLGEHSRSVRASRWYSILVCLTAIAFGTVLPLVFGKGIRPIDVSRMGQTAFGVDGWGNLLFVVYLIGLVLVLVHLENLYRNASPPVRHKLRLLVVGIFVAFACQIVATSHTLLFRLVPPSYPPVSATGFLGGQMMIAFALVRHRLLDSNLYVSRYVVYRSLTLVLVGGYLLSLGIAAEVLPRMNLGLDYLTGAMFAIAGGAVIALLLLSKDVRWKVKQFIQAHFYRHKYDYREEWMGFTRQLSRATTVSAVAERTVDRILEVMWVRQVALYVTGRQAEAIDLLRQVGYDRLPDTIQPTPAARQMLCDSGSRLPSLGRMDASPEKQQEIARDLLPGVPVGHLVPLVAMDTFVGLLVVGPEVSGAPFGVDDKDLLAAVAAQAAAMIVNARLAQDAAEARALQSLARLSAFVAHDLKNAVGMLSLLAENAPDHMHEREFQADAVRTLTEVTGRMQRLLGVLRTANYRSAHGTLQRNLATAVESALSSLKANIPSRITLETRLAPTPGVTMDPEHVRSLLENLIMNAIDATAAEGRITVETGTDGRWATLTVGDTGRGMSTSFVRDRLFRPFQTTKADGLGIGLFQSRHMVEALGGTLDAESREGVGTRMVVRLPVASAPRTEEQEAAGSWQRAEG